MVILIILIIIYGYIDYIVRYKMVEERINKQIDRD